MQIQNYVFCEIARIYNIELCTHIYTYQITWKNFVDQFNLYGIMNLNFRITAVANNIMAALTRPTKASQ